MTVEISADTGFLPFLNKLPEKSDTTVRFFNRSDFYTVHGSDALFVAKEVFKSTNNVKTIGSGTNKTESLALNKNQFESLVRDLLLVRQYRVEVYVGKGSEWSLEYKGSPGNLAQFEDLIFGLDVSAGGTVVGVKLSGKTLGICTVNVDDRLLSVCQIEDDEGLSVLEGLIVQLAPKEVVLPDTVESKLASKVATRCGTMVVSRKSSEFTMDGLAGHLNRLLMWQEGQDENCLALPELGLSVACAALHAVIKYLELTSNDSSQQQFSLEMLIPQQFVYVDTSAAHALGLLSRPGSLLSHLDRCRTYPGKRLLSQWVKQPLRDVARINERLSMVETLVADPEMQAALTDDHLRRFPDLQLLARRLQRRASTLQDCYKIYQAVERLEPLMECLQAAAQSPAMSDNFLIPLQDLKSDMNNFQEMMRSTLDMECVDKGEFLVRIEFSEDLAGLKERMSDLLTDMETELTNCARILKLEAGKGIKLDTNAQIGYHFRTTNKKEERSIRNQAGMRVIDGNKAGIRFESSKLAKLSSEYSGLKSEYDSCQKSIVDEILAVAGGYVAAILQISNVIAKLDVVTSFSVVSVNAPIPYVRPTIVPSERGILRLKQARHPVVETLDSISFIPNDVELDRAAKSFHIITGPNMGGKSTFLRTVGTCALLAHMGCFVPCDEAELSLLDAVLARVGAGDCQHIGVSTFMNEMVDTCAILKRATKDTLVLIDELGRGTSTYEGCGLAWSIARHLAVNTKAYSLFATHFQELTCLPDEVASAANFHVKAVATEGGLTLLYQVCPGPSDRSFGIEVAKMAKLPEKVIDMAQKKLVELEQKHGLGMAGVNLTPEEIQTGEALVVGFLDNLQRKGADAFEDLKAEILSKNHPYVTAILS